MWPVSLFAFMSLSFMSQRRQYVQRAVNRAGGDEGSQATHPSPGKEQEQGNELSTLPLLLGWAWMRGVAARVRPALSSTLRAYCRHSGIMQTNQKTEHAMLLLHTPKRQAGQCQLLPTASRA